LEYLSDSSHSHHSCYSPKEFDEESCAWILTHSKYRQWVFPNSSNLFWLTGGSGIGKTTLSSFIGKQLNKELANGSEPQAVVLSYFCDENTDILDLLRHLIWHYLQLRPDLFWIIAGKFDPKTRRLYDKENRIHGLFDSIQQLGSQGPSYVIIDGLDECVDKIEVQMLVEKIAQLGYYSESSTASFKVLLSFSDEISLSITSQSIPKMQRIDMYEEMKLADFKNLRCYAEKQIRNLAWVPSSKVDKIAEDLVTKAEGSFIWLYLTCSNMRERAPGFDPTQTSLLPEGMSSMIKKMILRIDLQDRSQAARVLRCLSAARRPLIINEIGDVLGLDSSETRRYVRCCGYLLSTYEGEKVKLCHNAIRQYLESKEVKDDQFIAEFGLGKIQEEISEVCFELLSREFRSHSDAAEKRPTANVSARPLSEYATKYWPNHARLAELPPSFFEHHNGELFKAMWRSNWERTGLAHRKIPRNFNLFHVGAVFGLVGLIRYYTDIISWNSLKLRQQLRKKDSTGHTPLSWAAEFGHEDIVQYLLFQEKLDPNGLQGPFGSALQTATSWGQVHIVELLLKGEPKIRASNIDEKKGKFGTALQAAAITGNSKIARILIKYGADPNIQKSGWFSNALQAAAANGSTEVVQLLLKAKNNADPNSQGGWYGNALRAASTKGYAKIVKMLLSHGAKVDHNEKLQDIISRFMSLRTILPPNTRLKASMHLAQRHSLISVVKSEAALIRSKMAKRYTKTVSTQEAFLFALHHVLYRSNLLSAEKGGSFGALTDEELQHLTDQGFEMYLRGLFYGNALQAAAAEGHTQVVDILMANHADVNANMGIFGTALQAAVAENKPDVVDLLLTRDDVDLYQRGGAYGSAMSAALREGYKDIEQKLRVAGLRRQGNAGRGNIETL
jgi:ankyrin repeat protein